MTLKQYDGTAWRTITAPKYHDGTAWRSAKTIKYHDGTAWRTIYDQVNVRDNNTGAVVSGSGSSIDYANTRDGSYGDTSTYGYASPALYNDTTIVQASFASQSISTGTLYVQTGYDYSADNRIFISATSNLQYSTDSGSNWTTLRTSSVNVGSAGASGQTASLSSMNLSSLKVRWTGQSADGYDPFNTYLTAVAWIRVYDVYVYYIT